MSNGKREFDQHDLEVTKQIVALDGKIDRKIAEINGKIDQSFAHLDSKLDGKIDLIMDKIDGYFNNTNESLKRSNERIDQTNNKEFKIEQELHRQNVKIAEIITETKSKTTWIALIFSAVINAIFLAVNKMIGYR